VDLDGDGLSVDPDEGGAADRGEHGDLLAGLAPLAFSVVGTGDRWEPTGRAVTSLVGGPDRGDLDGVGTLSPGGVTVIGVPRVLLAARRRPTARGGSGFRGA
jgi:hypothetical protein